MFKSRLVIVLTVLFIYLFCFYSLFYLFLLLGSRPTFRPIFVGPMSTHYSPFCKPKVAHEMAQNRPKPTIQAFWPFTLREACSPSPSPAWFLLSLQQTIHICLGIQTLSVPTPRKPRGFSSQHTYMALCHSLYGPSPRQSGGHLHRAP